MVYFKCSTCGIRLYHRGSRARAVGDLCPGCGSLLEPVGELCETGGFRSIESRAGGAPDAHQRNNLLFRRKARDDVERWLDDGGSFRGPAASRMEATL